MLLSRIQGRTWQPIKNSHQNSWCVLYLQSVEVIFTFLHGQRLSACLPNWFGFSEKSSTTCTIRDNQNLLVKSSVCIDSIFESTFDSNFPIMTTMFVLNLDWTVSCYENLWNLADLSASHGRLIADAWFFSHYKFWILLTPAKNFICQKLRNQQYFRWNHFSTILAP